MKRKRPKCKKCGYVHYDPTCVGKCERCNQDCDRAGYAICSSCLRRLQHA